MMSDRDVRKADSEDVKEECWGLPPTFNLFAAHETRSVFYPPPTACDDCCHSFEIECIEPNSPLDINNKTTSSNECDATGHCVWTGAFLLIQCLRQLSRLDIRNKRVIEYGAGTGIGGLSFLLSNDDSIVPSFVCFTDYDEHALKVCKRNCELNNIHESRYSIRTLTWGRDETVGKFDIALATDVLYDVDLIEPLCVSVSKAIPIDGLFILSHIPRACYNENNPPEAVENLEQYIIDQAYKFGMAVTEIIRPPSQMDDTGLVDWGITRSSFYGGGILVFRRVH
mmetsp:Transcript_27555/g.65536  ORF Transcript_27555/g.65536 Transcript_27555/m.65536 type:complete len:283 (+) Transcript_27555:196-1044(+)